MIKLAKMSLQDCTISVSDECTCASQLEAQHMAAKAHINIDGTHTKLMLVNTFENEHPLCWCVFGEENNELRAFFNLFREDPMPRSLPQSGRQLEEGEYFRHGNDVYITCHDENLGQYVRQLSVFATAQDADAAYHMSDSAVEIKSPEDYPDYYLVRLTEVDKPNQTLCISWYISRENHLMLLPVFNEDYPEFKAVHRNNLNWEFLHTGDTFEHNGCIYQVCEDDNEDYYIAPLYKTQLKIAVHHP